MKTVTKLGLSAALVGMLAVPFALARDSGTQGNAPGQMMAGQGMMGSDMSGMQGMMGMMQMMQQMGPMMDACAEMMQGAADSDSGKPNEQWRKGTPAVPDNNG